MIVGIGWIRQDQLQHLKEARYHSFTFSTFVSMSLEQR